MIRRIRRRVTNSRVGDYLSATIVTLGGLWLTALLMNH